MAASVVSLLLLTAALNTPSTARAAERLQCFEIGVGRGPPQALVVARPGVDVVAAAQRGRQDGTGRVLLRPDRRTCDVTYRLARRPPGERAPLWVEGRGSGTVTSTSTRVPGLVAASDLVDVLVEGEPVLDTMPGGDLGALDERLDETQDKRVGVRVALATIMILLLLVAPRRALMTGPAAITAALLLSSVGWTSVLLFALLTFLGSLAPLRALWAFFPAYLALLALSPETQALALLGPHPESGGRFYGITNELETLLLAPALLLGLGIAPIVLLLLAWSRAGADGGGVLVFVAAYAWLAVGWVPRRLAVLAFAGVAAFVAFVVVDAAFGASTHVAETVLDGPRAVWEALLHRWEFAWDSVTASRWRVLEVVACGAVVAWIATRRPRARTLDAFLVGIAVSLVVNDTPQDVLLWGSLQALALRRAL